MRYYQLSYCGIILYTKKARQRPSLTKGNPSLQSALRSLTSVFGMGTGVTFLPSSPHIFFVRERCSLKTESTKTKGFRKHRLSFLLLKNWLSPRPISIGPLHTSLYFHSQPIYLIISQGSYSLEVMGNLILRGASRLDAFSVYPVHT